MTTAVRPRPAAAKPLAAHGTTARAKGRPATGIKGCPCIPCRDAENRYDKHRRVLNATGRTVNVPAEPVAQHLDALFEAGAGWTQLTTISGVSASVISRVRRREQTIIRRTVADRILALQPGDATPPKRAVPAIGTVRRIQALMAAGHRCKDISAASNVEHSTISDLVNQRLTTIARHVAERINDGYRKLATTPGTNARARNRATREGWAPPAAWDDIDNPDTHPDWTGHCGTDRGWNVHRLTNIPVCPRCQHAHQQWLTERAHLDQRDRTKQAFAARRAANDRGVTLAEDIRELLRLGCDREQTARRLGITRDTLNATLTRHPEPAAERARIAQAGADNEDGAA